MPSPVQIRDPGYLAHNNAEMQYRILSNVPPEMEKLMPPALLEIFKKLAWSKGFVRSSSMKHSTNTSQKGQAGPASELSDIYTNLAFVDKKNYHTH